MKSEYCESARTLSGDEVMKVWRLGSCENFVGKLEKLVFNALSDPEPVKRALDGSDMAGFGSFHERTAHHHRRHHHQ